MFRTLKSRLQCHPEKKLLVSEGPSVALPQKYWKSKSDEICGLVSLCHQNDPER